MFRDNITLSTARKIADTINALTSAGDPATAEMMRRWFNASFRGFRLERVMDGKRTQGQDVREGSAAPGQDREHRAAGVR